MIKSKLVIFAATVSLVSSAAVFAAAKDAKKDAAQVTEKEAVTKQEVSATKAIKKKTHAAKPVGQSLAQEVKELKLQVADMQKQHKKACGNNLFAYGPSVVTTPIIGEPNYSGYDLYINLPSINEDLALLKMNQKVANAYAQNNTALPSRPVLALSGEIEGQAMNSSAFNGNSKSDINLATAAIEGVLSVNSWVNGLLKFEYNDSPADTGARVNNSQVKLKRGYITFGNLSEAPLYMTIGQLYVPFGTYTDWMITDPLTKTLGKTEERAAVVGFSQNGLYASAYAFKGDSYKNSGRSINSWGANLGYAFTENQWNLDFGAGYIANIADSLGMQDNGAKGNDFAGFGDGNEQLQRQVPAADLHALLSYDKASLAAEYVTAIERFDRSDLTYNDKGARPRALDVEAVYNFDVASKPTFISAGAGESWEALSLYMPKYSYFVSAGISLLKNTVQSIEFRHDINYDKNDVATHTGTYKDGSITAMRAGEKRRDMVTASFKLFF